MTFPIPNSALDDRLAFIGTSGSGKTYAASGSVEHLLAQRARCVIVDPLGVWYGLRLAADGRTPSPFDVVIFGGNHGDLPLNEHAGALIGETVAEMKESCIIDLSGLATKSAERRFMLAFLDAVYRKTDPRKSDPYHIIFDEADLWAPQKSSEPMLQSRMEEIVRRGRIRGFIPWLITQRPAVLSKDVLSQADGLIALKLTSSQDRDAIGAWIEGQADRQQGKTILASLPTMQTGQGVVWLPGRGVLETVQFPPKTTFDSSRTPKRGEKKHQADLKPLNIEALKERLAAVEQETKENDPKALKAEIAKLRKQLQTSAPVEKINTTPIDFEAIRNAAYDDGHLDGFRDGYISGRNAVVGIFGRALDEARAHGSPDGQHAPGTPPMAETRSTPLPKLPSGVKQADGLASGAPGLLEVVVRHWPARLTWGQVAALAGRKPRGGHFNAARKSLIDAGMVAEDGGAVIPTDTGFARAGGRPERPSDLSKAYLDVLPGPANKMLDVLLRRPKITADELGTMLSMQPRGGHWNSGLAMLTRCNLISKHGDQIVLNREALK